MGCCVLMGREIPHQVRTLSVRTGCFVICCLRSLIRRCSGEVKLFNSFIPLPCRVTIPSFPSSPLFTLPTGCFQICYGPQVLSPTVFLLPMFHSFKFPCIINSAGVLIFRSFSYSTCSIFYF